MDAKTRTRKNIVRFRQKKNWTQEHLAFEAGVSKSGLCDIESGKTSPTITTLDKIAEALGVSVAQLVK